MFNLICNITMSVITSIWFIYLTIVTGKMSKVSIYHFIKEPVNSNFYDICGDEYIKATKQSQLSNECKETTIKRFLLHLEATEGYNNSGSTHKIICNSFKDYIHNLEK